MRILIFGIVSLFISSMYAHIVQYTKLKRKDADTIVDILYDMKDYSFALPTDDDTFSVIKNRFSSAERRLLEAASKFQKTNYPVEFIWEFSPEYIQYSGSFIAVAPTLIRRYFPRITFTESAVARLDFKNGVQDSDFKEIRHWTVDDPLAVVRPRIERIPRISGETVFQQFEDTYIQKVGPVQEWWHRNQPRMWDGLVEYQITNVTVLELLANILSSEKKKVVVYADQWKAELVTRFLLEQQYSLLEQHKASSGSRLSEKDLAALDKEVSVAPVPVAPAVKPVSPKQAR